VVDHASEDFFAPPRVKARLKFAAIPRVHPAVELVFFGQVTNAGPGLGRQPPNVETQDGSTAPAGREQSQQHADGGGFAGAIAAQEREHTASRHRQVQFVHGGFGAEITRQTSCLDNGLVTHCSGTLLCLSIG
jgi:hypothetical protein